MKRALFICEQEDGIPLLTCLNHMKVFTIIGVQTNNLKLKELAESYQFPVNQFHYDEKHIDLIISNNVVDRLAMERMTLPEAWALVIATIDKQFLMQKAVAALDDGLIIVQADSKVQYMNDAAAQMADVDSRTSFGEPIQQLLPSSGLPRVIKTEQAEYNQLQTFANGTTIVTTRIPLTHNGTCTGAVAIFKDVTEATQMAEQITDLRSIQKMLEAIIHSSNDAISVVDELGTGLLINPAYTKMTGLLPEEIVGKPATTDISEGEVIHMQVLQTKRPVRGARLKLGPKKRDVIVNVAPIIVDHALKGSVGVIHDVSELNDLLSQLRKAKKKLASLEASYSFKDIIGASDGIKLAIEQAKLGANTSLPILLLGETGTGKELFAHAIHNESTRRKEPFVRVNCAALTETLLESELFGYEQGAFSGALRTGKKGLFEEAGKGSIFLDEVGEMSLSTQAKLLRVLQEQEIVRVGGTKPIRIQVRVIAATNADLHQSITNKTFREDLYYRLNKLPIRIPPLRERLDDLPKLALNLVEKINQDYGRNIQTISSLVLAQFQEYDWPGNVRELENVLARAMIYMTLGDTEIQGIDLPAEKQKNTVKKIELVENEQLTLDHYLASKEKEHILKTLAQVNGVKTDAAKRLGISIRSLYYKLDKHLIE
ncbi:LOW QUALITY PROTEIN: transcriptional regulator BkdR of isoleucine and valine catabolism operon [Bacillus sp. JCM 19046]|nr:LOW QUALITY PROTEIN: transcriptional regulator BkdR of isoleucine and valine catabolism operon [Bacillus sp. JCM 19046]